MKPSERQIETFWSHIERRADDECWDWQGKRNRGYGRHSFQQNGIRKEYFTHRLAYCLSNGINIDELPSDKVVMHLCDRPSCNNAKHLKLGTQAENLADMYAKGRAKLNPGNLIPATKKAREAW